jgi:hypothetical protein
MADGDGDKFSITTPENDAERDAMNDHFNDEDPEPTKNDVNERIGNDKITEATKGED